MQPEAIDATEGSNAAEVQGMVVQLTSKVAQLKSKVVQLQQLLEDAHKRIVQVTDRAQEYKAAFDVFEFQHTMQEQREEAWSGTALYY